MAAVRLLVAAVASLLAVLSLHSAAAPFAVQIGDTRLGLDAPPGFADTTSMGSPRLQELAEALTSASNRILLFAVTDADLRRFTLGDPLEAKRYMVAVTPRGLERERITPGSFTAFVSDSLRGLGAAPPAGTTDFRKHIDTLRGRPALLAELRRDPETVSVLQGVRLPLEGRTETPKYMLTSTTLLLIRGKAISLVVFGAYDSPDDLEWIRFITVRWIEELQRLNR